MGKLLTLYHELGHYKCDETNCEESDNSVVMAELHAYRNEVELALASNNISVVEAVMVDIMASSGNVEPKNPHYVASLALTHEDKWDVVLFFLYEFKYCLLYTSPSPRDRQKSRMPSSA